MSSIKSKNAINVFWPHTRPLFIAKKFWSPDPPRGRYEYCHFWLPRGVKNGKKILLDTCIELGQCFQQPNITNPVPHKAIGKNFEILKILLQKNFKNRPKLWKFILRVAQSEFLIFFAHGIHKYAPFWGVLRKKCAHTPLTPLTPLKVFHNY